MAREEGHISFDAHELTGTGRLSKNVLLNLLAEGVPLVVSLFCIPVLVHRLGTEQFGVLALAWAIIGYFGIFDLGLGRALSKIVAEKLGLREYGSIPALFWTGFAMMGILGLVATAILGGGASFAVVHLLSISPGLQHETLIVLYLLAATIPFVIITTGMMGVLAAHQRFDLVLKIRMPIGTWMFLGPVIAVLIFHTLVSVVVMMVIGRCVMFFMAWMMCHRAVHDLTRPIFRQDALKSLLGFGSWVTVSNLISPIMEYMDRFFIATVIGLSAVTYYAIPYTVAAKLQTFPIILFTVLFPALSAMLAFDRERARRIFNITNTIILAVMLPIVLLVIDFGNYGLSLWLGSNFAHHSTMVLQILMTGILINSLGLLSYVLIQADGRPDITAKLHLIELPIYIAFLWYALHAWGIVGAAIAWSLRVSLDWILLLGIATFKIKSRIALRLVGFTAGLILSLWVMAQIDNLIVRSIVCLFIAFIFAILNWLYLLDVSEKNDMKRYSKKVLTRLPKMKVFSGIR